MYQGQELQEIPEFAFNALNLLITTDYTVVDDPEKGKIVTLTESGYAKYSSSSQPSDTENATIFFYTEKGTMSSQSVTGSNGKYSSDKTFFELSDILPSEVDGFAFVGWYKIDKDIYDKLAAGEEATVNYSDNYIDKTLVTDSSNDPVYYAARWAESVNVTFSFRGKTSTKQVPKGIGHTNVQTKDILMNVVHYIDNYVGMTSSITDIIPDAENIADSYTAKYPLELQDSEDPFSLAKGKTVDKDITITICAVLEAKVGDAVLTNGSVLSKADIAGYANKDDIVGIVVDSSEHSDFFDKKYTTKSWGSVIIVSLQANSYQWAKEGSFGASYEFDKLNCYENNISATYEDYACPSNWYNYEGDQAWSEISSISGAGDISYYPAFEAAKAYSKKVEGNNSSWYVPSFYEGMALYVRRSTISKSIVDAGGDTLDGSIIWTSSDYAIKDNTSQKLGSEAEAIEMTDRFFNYSTSKYECLHTSKTDSVQTFFLCKVDLCVE